MKTESSQPYSFSNIVDTLIKLGILFLLLGYCVDILRPFVLILVWAMVIAIAIHPLHNFFTRKMRMKNALASTLIIILMLSIIIVPSWLVMQSLAFELDNIRVLYKQGQLVIPKPGPSTASWPRFAQPLVDFWKLASDNLEAAALKYSVQIKSAGAWLLSAVAGVAFGILQFMASIIIAGILLAYTKEVRESASKIFGRLAGSHGEAYMSLITSTVRNVVKGILGVAIIQAAMAGLGFFIAGVPYAGVWTALVLVLAVIQVGAGPVAIPIAIYMFSATDTLTASLLAGWLGLTLVSDNVLKPLLLGRGASVPMLVVFLGAIGGFIVSGILGLFLGAVVLSIGYKLAQLWLNPAREATILAENSTN